MVVRGRGSDRRQEPAADRDLSSSESINYFAADAIWHMWREHGDGHTWIAPLELDREHGTPPTTPQARGLNASGWRAGSCARTAGPSAFCEDCASAKELSFRHTYTSAWTRSGGDHRAACRGTPRCVACMPKRHAGASVVMPKHTSLYLIANPRDTDPLALDQGVRSIQFDLERSRPGRRRSGSTVSLGHDATGTSSWPAIETWSMDT